MNDQNRHPYKIAPDVQFNLESIPVFGIEERINFFYKYKRTNENLYLGKINKDNLLLKPSDSLLRSVEPYFVKKQFLDPRIVTDFSKRLFPKVCWLTDSFFKNGFKYPISAHYNPRIEKNVIHPGSIRNHVIKLFQTTDDVNCLYFNSGGVSFDFMNTLRVVEQDELIKFKDDIQIELVADHASIIPHINLDYKSVAPNIVRWQEFIYRRLTSPTFTMSCNANINMFVPWFTTEDKSYINVTINEPLSKKTKPVQDDIICKIAILSILGRSYQCDDFKITHKISFSTLE
jgi:hypothetical protein